jgi:hypothetical protein
LKTHKYVKKKHKPLMASGENPCVYIDVFFLKAFLVGIGFLFHFKQKKLWVTLESGPVAVNKREINQIWINFNTTIVLII